MFLILFCFLFYKIREQEGRIDSVWEGGCYRLGVVGKWGRRMKNVYTCT
jgi:hypothetical protein